MLIKCLPTGKKVIFNNHNVTLFIPKCSNSSIVYNLIKIKPTQPSPQLIMSPAIIIPFNNCSIGIKFEILTKY